MFLQDKLILKDQSYLHKPFKRFALQFFSECNLFWNISGVYIPRIENIFKEN